MLNFIKAINEAKLEYENERYGIRVFEGIATKTGYDLSIQCSANHYCTPRKTLDELNSYDTFELAIFCGEECTYPSILDGFSRKKELNKYYEDTVFSFVPKDLVEDLYNYLNNK